VQASAEMPFDSTSLDYVFLQQMLTTCLAALHCVVLLCFVQASAEMPFGGTGLDDVFLEPSGDFSHCFVLLCLVQASAEMPFDGTGLDDVFLELTGEFSEILDLGSALPSFNDSGTCFNAVRSAQSAAATAAARAVAAVADGPPTGAVQAGRSLKNLKK
jgi:hypothetical protein